MKYIDLYAGAGGFCLGFKLAGFNPVLSIEQDRYACMTLESNFEHAILKHDLDVISTERNISSILNEKIDLIIGGPPCQGFSNAAKNRVFEHDKRNRHPYNFMNWVRVVEPKAFVIENVPGLEKARDGRGRVVIEVLRSKAKALGYKCDIWRLNAADFGVPQVRRRIFFVGIKRFPGGWSESMFSESMYPVTTHEKEKHLTVSMAISDLPHIRSGEGVDNYLLYDTPPKNDYQKWCRSVSKVVYNHVAMKHSRRIVERYQHIIDGETNLPESLRVRARNGNGVLSSKNYRMNYRHLHPSKPSFTIPASFYSTFVHPFIPRNITTREAARLQSFPDSFKFEGSRTQISKNLLARQGKFDKMGLSQYNQVGNAVPPLLAMAVAQKLYSLIA